MRLRVLRPRRGIGRVDPVDIAVDLAIGVEGGREGHRRRVGATAAEGGHFALVRDPLETTDDHHVAGRELVEDPKRTHLHDAGTSVLMVGDDPTLASP